MIIKPSKRYTASQVLNHKWMKEKKSSKGLALNWDNLKKFHNAAKLKKAALTYLLII